MESQQNDDSAETTKADEKQAPVESNEAENSHQELAAAKRKRDEESEELPSKRMKPPGESKSATATASSVASAEAVQTSQDEEQSKGSANNFAVDKEKVNELKRWRVQQMAEDYINLSSKMMLVPTSHLGPYGNDDDNNKHQGNGETGKQSYPLELISSLGFLKSPLRRPAIIETWSPHEISLFEAGMGHYGKDFYEIHKLIKTKSTKEVVDFYYIWKKTSHYKVWKKQYVAPAEAMAEDEYATTPVKKPVR